MFKEANITSASLCRVYVGIVAYKGAVEGSRPLAISYSTHDVVQRHTAEFKHLAPWSRHAVPAGAELDGTGDTIPRQGQLGSRGRVTKASSMLQGVTCLLHQSCPL